MSSDSHGLNPKATPPRTIENHSYTEVKTSFVSFDNSLRAFLQFLGKIRQYFITAFFIGLGLAISGELLFELLPQDHVTFWIFLGKFTFLLIKDAGIALSVSAIAVFGYERIKHARGEFRQMQLMDAALSSLDQATKRLQAMESLQASVSALSEQIDRQGKDLHTALKSNVVLAEKLTAIIQNLAILNAGDTYEKCNSALSFIFSSTPGGDVFCESVQELLRVANELKSSESNQSQIQPYLTFLGWLIEQVPNRYAKALSHFVTSDDGTSPVRDIPSASSMASQFLSSYMNSMQGGDEYLAVSNILYWDAGQWDAFQAEVRAACCERGVKSRRIVNLCSYLAKREKQQLTNAEVRQARERVSIHLNLKEAAPDNYQVRFFGPNEIQKVARSVEELHHFATMAFGIFLYDHNGIQLGKIVRPEDEFVSTLSFDHNIYKYRSMFERIWNEARLEDLLDELKFQNIPES